MAEKTSHHSYVVKSVLKSTAVQHALAGSFTRQGATEVVLAKGTILELVAPSEDGSLVTLCEQSIYGSILDAKLLPWNDSFHGAPMPSSLVGCNLLVLLSNSDDLAFVGYDTQLHKFVSIGHLDLQKEGFSITRLPALLAADPAGRAVAVAAEGEHLALFHASPMAGAKIMEGALPNASPPGLGHQSWDAIVSMVFVRPSADDTDNGVLKLAVIVRRDDSPGHEVLILFHDTRDRSTHLWARLPPSANLCPSAGNLLPLLVLAPPHMSETLLVARAGDLIALDLSFDGPVVRATWTLGDKSASGPSDENENEIAYRQPESLALGALDLASDAPQAPGLRVRSSGKATEAGWELDLRSPDAETTRVAKRRVRERRGDPSGEEEVTFGDWNDENAEAAQVADEGSSVVKDGPSICAWGWRSDGSGKSESLVLSMTDGGLQILELTRRRGVDGPDWRFVPRGSCDEDTCRPCSAVVWLREGLVGAFVRGGDGHVMNVGADSDLAPVAEIPNAAPIVDFQLVDHFDEKQNQLFACCGEGPTASIRGIRPGIGAERLLSTPPAYKGVAGVWAMRMSARDAHHSFLVMSFVSETRVLSVGLSFHDVTEAVGFQQNASTLACGPIADCHVIQICAQAIHLCAPTHKAHPSGLDLDQPYTATWRPPDGSCVSVGAVSTGRVIVGLSRPSGLVMLGVERRPSDGGHVALVQLQSCSVGAELSCISLQERAEASGRPGDVTADVGTRVELFGKEAAACLSAKSRPSAERLSPHVSFSAQAGAVCILGTYRPSVEVRSALPGDGFRLLAEVPLAAGTAFQQRGMPPGFRPRSSDDRNAAAPTSSCVPESVLMSFFDRGYLLVGLRNGLLARYGWPTDRLEAALSARNEETSGQHNEDSPVASAMVEAEKGTGSGILFPVGAQRSSGKSNGASHEESATNGVRSLETSPGEDRGESMGRKSDPCTVVGGPATPVILEQVGEKRIGSAPVSLIPLASSDAFSRESNAAGQCSGASERNPDAPGASDQSSDAPSALKSKSNGEAAPVSSVFAEVLVLSNQPWLLHRSSRGRCRMMTSPVAHPASAHATGVSCGECPRGIVFMTDCCMHLVELDPNKKTDVHKLPCPGGPQRLLYHPPSKTLIIAGTTPVESPENPRISGPNASGTSQAQTTGRALSAATADSPLFSMDAKCIDPETGAVLCSFAANPHASEKCVSLSLWASGSDRFSVVGTTWTRAPDHNDRILLALRGTEPESKLRGGLSLYKLQFPEGGVRGTPPNGRLSDGVSQGDRSSRIPAETESERNGNTTRPEWDQNGNDSEESQWRFERVTLRSLPGPVLATCRLSVGPSGRSYLAVAAGCHVFVFGFAGDAFSGGDMTSRLRLMAKARTRFPIVALSPAVRPSKHSHGWLFVGDSQDGALLYRFAPGSLELALADPERRSLADVIAAPGDVRSAAVLADRGGGVGVTSGDGRLAESKSPEKNLDVRAWFNLGDTPTRLRDGSAFHHQPSTPRLSAQAHPRTGSDSQPAGEALAPGKAVFVATHSGGVHSVEGAHPLEYEFLALVQESLAAFPATAPLMGNGYAAFRARGSRAKGRPMLDVDFLTQFLDLTEAQQLAVLTARSAALARALSRLMNEEDAADPAGDDVIDLEGCQGLREVAGVLIENL